MGSVSDPNPTTHEEINMSTTTPSHDDLSYLRRLAESGRDVPLMAGPYLMAGGGWFAAASLTQWPVLRNLVQFSETQAMGAWLVAAAGFAVHLAVLIRRDRHRTETVGNRAVSAVWTGAGFGIFAFWLGVATLAYQRGDAWVMNTISLQVLSVYGTGWMVAAAMARQGWMQAVAALAFLFVPVLGLVIGSGHEYLVYALALLATAVLPGRRLARQARQALG